MSVQALTWVFDHSNAAGTDRLVLLSLANHAGANEVDGAWECWPGVALVTQEAGLKRERTTQEALTRLEEQGRIERHINAAPDSRIRGDRRPNLYRILKTNGVTPHDIPPDAARGDASRTNGVTPHAARGDASRQNGVTPRVTRTVSEPSPEPSEGTSAPTPSAPTRRKGKAPKVLDPLTEAADAIARHVWENRDPRPAANFMGVRGVFRRLLDAGWLPEQVQAAGMAVPALTVHAMEFELNRAANPQRGHGDERLTAAEQRRLRNDEATKRVIGAVAAMKGEADPYAPEPPTKPDPFLALTAGPVLDVKELTA